MKISDTTLAKIIFAACIIAAMLLTIEPMQWIKVSDQLPPQGLVVDTKIANPDRNEQQLKLVGKLWFEANGTMYVYYVPTHWRHIKNN